MENQRLQATVERVVFFNPETGYAVARVRARGERDLVTAVGKLSEVHPGEALQLEGRWITDPRHGRQFQARSVRVRRPADVNGLMAYLGSGLVPGLGPVLARRIVEHFGEQVLAVLDEDPSMVREVPGVGAARARALATAWARQREVRRVMEWLREREVSTLYAPRIFEVYGDQALARLEANPYRLALEVAGFGFVAADDLGKVQGVRPDSPVRLQAAAEWCLRRAADDGDCYVPYGELKERTARATGSNAQAAEAALAQLAAASRIAGVAPPAVPPIAAATVVSTTRGKLSIYVPSPSSGDPETPIYLSAFEHAEAGVARHVARLAGTRADANPGRLERWLGRFEAAAGIQLAPEQRRAVMDGATAGVFILTGGPGTGKTTALRALHRLLVAMGRSVALAAPTGKAARRLAEVTGAPASTVHRMLGAGRDGQAFAFHEENPLPFDVVVVDESSMLDLFLAYGLLRAVKSGAQLVLVGDADQLPSVGPGQVLRDLLASEAVPAVHLSQVFRQAATSRIVTAAHEVRRGSVPLLPSPDREEGDLWLVEVPRGEVGNATVAWATDKLSRRLGLAPGDVQVLSPQLRGDAGTETLNARLQERLNPGQAGKTEWFRGALPLREADRVIHTANNYRLDVFNGETGHVAHIDRLAQVLTVDFGDRQVAYSAADVLEIQHAYALTVHRAQGSEWPAVVVALASEHVRNLERNLLYTALTRARQAAVLVAERGVLEEAIGNVSALARRTGLAKRVAEQLSAVTAQPSATDASESQRNTRLRAEGTQ